METQITENQIDVKEQEVIDMSDEDGEALTLDDFKGSFISNPAVGATGISFKIHKIVKLTGAKVIGKKTDGSTFKKNLSNVDYGYEIITVHGAKYTISSWEVFGKMKNIFQKLNCIEGVEIHIKHTKDGMKEKDGDNYKVAALVEGTFKTLNRNTREWE